MAAREYFHGLLQTGRPSDAQFELTYGLKPLPITTRTSFSGWSDGATLPPAQWFDNAAAGLAPTHGWVLIDHEDWPQGTQAERLDTASKFSALYAGLKSRRPDLKIGFYSYAPKRDLFRAIKAHSDPDYLAWQDENDDMAEMVSVVDGLFPSIYYFYTRAVNGDATITAHIPLYFQENIAEAKRLRQRYGRPTNPIYPYIWWMRHDETSELDADVWQAMIAQATDLADGFVLWGGWLQSWDGRAAWWKTVRDQMRTRQPRKNQGRMTAAAG